MTVWTRSEMKKYQGMIRHLSLHLTPLLQVSSTPPLDTILADVSREVREPIFHIHIYCFQNKLSFSSNLSSFCKHYQTQGNNTNNTSKNKHKNERGKEAWVSSFVCFFYVVFNLITVSSLNSAVF